MHGIKGHIPRLLPVREVRCTQPLSFLPTSPHECHLCHVNGDGNPAYTQSTPLARGLDPGQVHLWGVC